MSAENSTPDIFKLHSRNNSHLQSFRSSADCQRYFCPTCGTHLYIQYDSPSQNNTSKWAGEIHFPTALLDENSFKNLEESLAAAGKPRYLHVFYSDRHGALGDLSAWAMAPKYGGSTGMEVIDA